MMTSSYDWFVQNAASLKTAADSSAHKSPVRQGVLRILKAIS
jgi:hypothetical protein